MRTFTHLSFLLLTVFLSLPTDVARADRMTDSTFVHAKLRPVETQFRLGLTSLELGGLRSPQVQAVLTATIENKRVDAEFGFKLWNAGGGEIKGTVKVGGPVSKDAKEAELATLEGLTKDTQGTLGLRWVSRTPEGVLRSSEVSSFASTLMTSLDSANIDMDSAFSTGIDINDLSAEARRDFISKTLKMDRIWLSSVDVTFAAPREFEYFDTDSLAMRKETHDGLAVTAGIGLLLVTKGYLFFGVSGRYEEGFKEKDKKRICSPIGTSESLSCQEIPVGAPEEKKRKLVQFEVRQFVRGGHLGFNPKVTYDFVVEKPAIDFPIYFLKDKNGGLNGGVAAGYRWDKHEWVYRAFVGGLIDPLAGN